jgi:hypothetical protein
MRRYQFGSGATTRVDGPKGDGSRRISSDYPSEPGEGAGPENPERYSVETLSDGTPNRASTGPRLGLEVLCPSFSVWRTHRGVLIRNLRSNPPRATDSAEGHPVPEADARCRLDRGRGGREAVPAARTYARDFILIVTLRQPIRTK